MGYQDSGNRSCAFHNGNHNGDNYGNNKTIQKNVERNFTNVFDWKPFRDSSAWDVIRGYLPVNLILIFGFINVEIMLLRMYLRKKFEYV